MVVYLMLSMSLQSRYMYSEKIGKKLDETDSLAGEKCQGEKPIPCPLGRPFNCIESRKSIDLDYPQTKQKRKKILIGKEVAFPPYTSPLLSRILSTPRYPNSSIPIPAPGYVLRPQPLSPSLAYSPPKSTTPTPGTPLKCC